LEYHTWEGPTCTVPVTLPLLNATKVILLTSND